MGIIHLSDKSYIEADPSSIHGLRIAPFFELTPCCLGYGGARRTTGSVVFFGLAARDTPLGLPLKDKHSGQVRGSGRGSHRTCRW